MPLPATDRVCCHLMGDAVEAVVGVGEGCEAQQCTQPVVV
jgi:hypothetical protein